MVGWQEEYEFLAILKKSTKSTAISLYFNVALLKVAARGSHHVGQSLARARGSVGSVNWLHPSLKEPGRSPDRILLQGGVRIMNQDIPPPQTRTFGGKYQGRNFGTQYRPEQLRTRVFLTHM
jgi:hypothetical protein